MEKVKAIYNLMFDLFKMGRQDCARNIAIGWARTKYADFAEAMADAVEATVGADEKIAKKIFFLTWEEISQGKKAASAEEAAEIMLANFNKYGELFPKEFKNGVAEKSQEYKVLLNFALVALSTPFVYFEESSTVMSVA